ncbi:MAG: putative NAD-dependent alcohol dehydrogenase [Dehalococcoidia bacterium]|nr:putative NAD-dependent alcohol dehydrogenase [Dehalococcoidia bacterium]
MKAVFIAEYGEPDRLTYGDVPEPRIDREEVLVQVRACSLNRREMFVREGSHGTRTSLPQVMGMEGAGDVVQVGEGVTNIQVGDRVFGRLRGAYAEYAKGPYQDLYPLPEGMSYQEGSTISVVFPTAWHLLICRDKVSLGEDVLIMAAGSGVGIAAIQIAKGAGCRVFTTASTDEKLEKAMALGADVGINYREEEFSKRVLELTDGQGVDLVLDHIGAPVWEQCFASIKRGGRFINCGVSAGHLVQLHLGQLWTRDLTIMGSSGRPREDMPKILPLLARGDLKPVIAKAFPLEQATEAHRVMEASDFFGKIVLYN